MIVGIGVDRVVISRIRGSLARFSDRFVTRIYTAAEYDLARKKGVERRLAMFFAAKEAVSKALGTGFVGFGMKDIEVTYEESGKPNIILHAGASMQAECLGITTIHISLTDDEGVAMAFAVAESI